MIEPAVLSLVTGKLGRDDSFQRLVDSIIRTTHVRWELVVSDASEIPYAAPQDNIHVIHEKPKLDMARGYNIAFGQAIGKWVIWLNDDCEVMPHYAEAAIDFMEAHPTIGIGVLCYRDPSSDWHTSRCLYDMLYANFGILNRDFGNSIGWFDAECCPMYGSDNTIAYRCLLAGRGIAAVPGQHILHHAEDDQHRLANQNARERDAGTIRAKYGPHADEMRLVYEKTLFNLMSA